MKNFMLLALLCLMAAGAYFVLTGDQSETFELNIPAKLNPGDTIGVVATSLPASRETVDKMTSFFTERGYKVKLGEHCMDSFGFLSGPAEGLAEDFNKMVADSSVRMIMPANGGVGAVHLLPLIDYELIRQNPKIICAYSDPSILLNTITLRTGVPTFHGTDAETFTMITPDSLTQQSWQHLVGGGLDLPFVYPDVEMKVLRAGPPAEGRLFGGNQSRLLIGTEWLQIPEKSILFFEGVRYTPYLLDFFLAQLRLHGILDSISGLIIGRHQSEKYNAWWGEDAETMEDIILRNCEGYDFPIVYDMLIGHTEEKITLPIGARFRLDAGKREIALLEPVVK